MGEYGYGVIATDFIPSNTYVSHYFAQLWPASNDDSTDDIRSISIEDDDKKTLGNLDASLYRNFGAFFQHAPVSLDNYCIADATYENKIATQNINIRYLKMNNFFLAAFRTNREVSPGELLVWDYDDSGLYFELKEQVPALFTLHGQV